MINPDVRKQTGEIYFTLNLQKLLPKTGAQYEKGDVENALIKYSWGRTEIDTLRKQSLSAYTLPLTHSPKFQKQIRQSRDASV